MSSVNNRYTPRWRSIIIPKVLYPNIVRVIQSVLFMIDHSVIIMVRCCHHQAFGYCRRLLSWKWLRIRGFLNVVSPDIHIHAAWKVTDFFMRHEKWLIFSCGMKSDWFFHAAWEVTDFFMRHEKWLIFSCGMKSD